MVSDQPSQPPEVPPTGVGGSSPEPTPREVLRGLARVELDRLPPGSLPTKPVPPDAVRELAADLAAAVLERMTVDPAEDTQGFAVSYQCTGASYSCTVNYRCTVIFNRHSCTNSFSCTGHFSSPSFMMTTPLR